jgi:hypothetical protein
MHHQYDITCLARLLLWLKLILPTVYWKGFLPIWDHICSVRSLLWTYAHPHLSKGMAFHPHVIGHCNSASQVIATQHNGKIFHPLVALICLVSVSLQSICATVTSLFSCLRPLYPNTYICINTFTSEWTLIRVWQKHVHCMIYHSLLTTFNLILVIIYIHQQTYVLINFCTNILFNISKFYSGRN